MNRLHCGDVVLSGCRASGQLGQATIEALIALLVLTPLLLGLQALAQLQAVTLATTQAARYLGLSTSLGGRTVAERLSSFNLAQTLQGDSWSATLERGAEPLAAARATQSWRGALTPVNVVARQRTPIERQGWVRARAEQRWPVPAFLSTAVGDSYLSPSASMVLLTEDAAAVGRDEVSGRVATLNAMRPLSDVLNLMRPVAVPLMIVDPSIMTLCSLPPDVDLLPRDRLIGAPATPAVRRGC